MPDRLNCWSVRFFKDGNMVWLSYGSDLVRYCSSFFYSSQVFFFFRDYPVLFIFQIRVYRVTYFLLCYLSFRFVLWPASCFQYFVVPGLSALLEVELLIAFSFSFPVFHR